MIGNDICFLRQDRSNERLERYLRKITTENERKVLSPFEMSLQVPFVWSLKEASYKFFRKNKQISSHPKNFLVNAIRPYHGQAFSNHKYFKNQGFSNYEHIESNVETLFGNLVCKTIITDDFVHSILSEKQEYLEQTYWGIDRIETVSYALQRAAVRRNAVNHLAEIYRDQTCFEFRKNKNHAPILFVNDVKSKNNFSFSHDQNYVGYAWCAPPENTK